MEGLPGRAGCRGGEPCVAFGSAEEVLCFVVDDDEVGLGEAVGVDCAKEKDTVLPGECAGSEDVLRNLAVVDTGDRCGAAEEFEESVLFTKGLHIAFCAAMSDEVKCPTSVLWDRAAKNVVAGSETSSEREGRGGFFFLNDVF